jgi:hypothetical protein
MIKILYEFETTTNEYIQENIFMDSFESQSFKVEISCFLPYNWVVLINRAFYWKNAEIHSEKGNMWGQWNGMFSFFW